MIIPFQFRVRWQSFFVSVLPQFLGYSSYTEATPIVKAIIDFSRLAIATALVWLIVMLVIKFVKVVFG